MRNGLLHDASIDPGPVAGTRDETASTCEIHDVVAPRL